MVTDESLLLRHPVPPRFSPAPALAFAVPLTLSLRCVPAFLPLFSRGLFLLTKAVPYESMFGFLFLCTIQGIINCAKASCLATSEMGSDSKHRDDVWCGLVRTFWLVFPEFLSQVLLPFQDEGHRWPFVSVEVAY